MCSTPIAVEVPIEMATVAQLSRAYVAVLSLSVGLIMRSPGSAWLWERGSRQGDGYDGRAFPTAATTWPK